MLWFTFILDFEGGTCLSQAGSKGLQNACVLWSKALNEKEIYNLGKSGKNILIQEIVNEKAVAVNNLENVWCLSVLLRGKLALITVVQTDKENN